VVSKYHSRERESSLVSEDVAHHSGSMWSNPTSGPFGLYGLRFRS